MKESYFKSLRNVFWKLQIPMKSWIMTGRPKWQLMHWDGLYLERENGTLKKEGQQLLLVEKAPGVSLVQCRKATKEIFPSRHLCSPGSSCQPPLRSGESWLKLTNPVWCSSALRRACILKPTMLTNVNKGRLIRNNIISGNVELTCISNEANWGQPQPWPPKSSRLFTLAPLPFLKRYRNKAN